jgi:predicted permease
MDLWGIEIDWNEFTQAGAYRTWLMICAGLGVAAMVWIAILLTRGGFNDLDDITRSPYATPAERVKANAMRLPRSLLMLFAAAVGALGVAIPILFQGVVVIFLWRQAFG